MTGNRFAWLGCCLLAALFITPSLLAADFDRLSRQVSRLKLERGGYTLGAALTGRQLAISKKNLLESTVPGTYKFRDNTVVIVAQESTNRVLVIYERFEQANVQKAQDVVGELYLHFEDPTVMAHEQVVYWAYSKSGKINAKVFENAKNQGKKLDILATVKYISDVKLMGKSKEETETTKGLVYYIISSDPMLQFFKDKKNTL